MTSSVSLSYLHAAKKCYRPLDHSNPKIRFLGQSKYYRQTWGSPIFWQNEFLIISIVLDDRLHNMVTSIIFFIQRELKNIVSTLLHWIHHHMQRSQKCKKYHHKNLKSIICSMFLIRYYFIYTLNFEILWHLSLLFF